MVKRVKQLNVHKSVYLAYRYVIGYLRTIFSTEFPIKKFFKYIFSKIFTAALL